MKLRDVIALPTLSSVMDQTAIEKRVNNHDRICQSFFLYSVTLAIQRQLIGQFCYGDAFYHFDPLAGLRLSLTFSAYPSHGLHAGAFLPTACLLFTAFIIVLMFVYVPLFSGIYPPLPDTDIEDFTGRQQKVIYKCKNQQFMKICLRQYCPFREVKNLTNGSRTKTCCRRQKIFIQRLQLNNPALRQNNVL